MGFIRADVGVVHVLDVGTDGRVVYQIRTLVIQTIFQRNHLIQPGVVTDSGATEQATSLHIFPKKREEHVAQMPTGHG